MLLQVSNLSVTFGGIRAVDDVSFSVERGAIFGIIGPNGAGKTTMFNLISRIYAPKSGRIVFDGHDITALAPHRIAALGIARTFQNIELFEQASVTENLLLGCHCKRQPRLFAELLHLPSVRNIERQNYRKVEEVIEFTNLRRYRSAPVGGLPYGVRKVVELARALCGEPTLLLLDEPSSGLNVEETEQIGFKLEDIRDVFGTTIVMIEHDMRLVGDVCDNVVALNHGRVLATGSFDAVQAHPEVIEAYLGGALQ
jgi:branched-chain amino acid transport system ATP-binding protein